MRWSASVSEAAELSAAVAACAGAIRGDLGGEQPSVVFAFVSAAYRADYDRVPGLLRGWFPGAVLAGCSAGGVIGAGAEIEDRPAVSLTAAVLPGVSVVPWRAEPGGLPSPDDPPSAWSRLVGVSAAARPALLLFVDPFSGPAGDLLAGLDFAFAGAPKAGGMASGGGRPGECALWLGDRVYRDGVVGLALSGPLVMDTVVAQGCRPVGELRQVTACDGSLLLELDGEPAVAYLMELYPTLSPADQELVKRNLQLGIAVDSLALSGADGSERFLIRNVLGADPKRGLVAVGEELREGQLVQFHVRDATTSAEDLDRELRRYAGRVGGEAPAGVLLFQCNGRGRHLYGRSGHDTQVLGTVLGVVPVGGFFCGGEIGMVGDTTYVHGFSSVLALFREVEDGGAGFGK